MNMIFTDGASKGNPGPGGWGAIISLKTEESEDVIELGGGEKETTNNRMELKAVIESLLYLADVLEQPIEVLIYTDSRYVVMGASQWIYGWKKNGWQTASKTPVQNKDLWEKYADIASSFEIEWKLLPGHRGIPGNERADVIASSFASGEEVRLYHGPISSYEYDLRKTTAVFKEKKSGDAYSYLSMIDGKIMRHQNWASCKARVNGKKAQFKKALSPESEKAILKEWGCEGSQIQDAA